MEDRCACAFRNADSGLETVSPPAVRGSAEARTSWPLHLCAGILWPLATVAAVSRLLLSRHAFFSSAHRTIAAVILVIASCIGFALDARRPAEMRVLLRVSLGTLPGASLIFFLVATTTIQGHVQLFLPSLVAMFSGAFSEEVVFRALLPAFLIKHLRVTPSKMIVPIAIAQLVFALAHYVSPATITSVPSPSRFGSLFIGGLLLSSLALNEGLGIAIAVHASLNLSLAFPGVWSSSSQRPSSYAIWMCGGVAIVALSSRFLRGGHDTTVRNLFRASQFRTARSNYRLQDQ